MQYRTVIIDSDNWALATSEYKAVLHWAIKDRPWLNVRTFGFEVPPERYPVQLSSLNWREAHVNTQAAPDNKLALGSLLLTARVKLFTELSMRIEIARENLGFADPHETLVLFHDYLAAQHKVEGDFEPDSVITFQNRLKTLRSLEQVKARIIDVGLAARSKEAFDAARQEMERLFFTNILL